MHVSPSAADRKLSLGSLIARSGEARRILIIGIAIAAVGSAATILLARRREQAEFSLRAASLTAHIEESLVAPLEALKAVDALTQAIPEPSPEAFARFTAQFLDRYPSLAALEWAQLVLADERTAFEAKGSLERGRTFEIRAPDATGKLVRSPPRDRYAVITRMAPQVAELDGLDAAFEPVRARFLDDASRRRSTTASAKFRLVEDPPGMYSVAVYEPQFAGNPPAVHSLAVALYRIAPLLRRVVDGGSGGALRSDEQLTLIDEDPELPPADRVMFSTAKPHTAAANLQYTHAIAFAGRHWLAVVSVPRASHSLGAAAVFVVGALLAMAVGVAVAAIRASAELRKKNQALASLGQYKLVRLLATGGMGHVYEAQHTLLRRRTAVKVIAARDASAQMRALFDEEAKITSVLTHDNTITVFDYGHSADGEFYLAMEYVVGLSLDTIVQRYGRLPPARVRHILIQICGSLAEAHALGVVHRDIKPANIMVGPRAGAYDHVKVLDFGLAKTMRTGAENVVGTPRYMAPEAFVAPDALSHSADIYSLGCVAFFLLTGRDVFEHSSYDSLVEAHLSEPPPKVGSLGIDRTPHSLDGSAAHPSEAGVVDRTPHSLNGSAAHPGEAGVVDLSAEFERVIAKCLEKDPDRRFRSARHLASALAQLSLEEWTAVEAGQWWANVDFNAAPSEGVALRKTIEVRAA